MLKGKLQVSSSTLTPENSVRDKWPQQSHPAEDGGGCSGPAGADDAARTQFTACCKAPYIYSSQSALREGFVYMIEWGLL